MAQRDAQQVHRVLILGSSPEFADQLMVSPNVPGVVD
jgi:hypothetical protein